MFSTSARFESRMHGKQRELFRLMSIQHVSTETAPIYTVHVDMFPCGSACVYTVHIHFLILFQYSPDGAIKNPILAGAACRVRLQGGLLGRNEHQNELFCDMHIPICIFRPVFRVIVSNTAHSRYCTPVNAHIAK